MKPEKTEQSNQSNSNELHYYSSLFITFKQSNVVVKGVEVEVEEEEDAAVGGRWQWLL